MPNDHARIARALTEPMEIIATAKAWQFSVRTAHGVYTVDVHAKTCTCLDFRNRITKMRRAGQRDAMCKHLLRVVNGTRLLQGMLIVGTPKRRVAGVRMKHQVYLLQVPVKAWNLLTETLTLDAQSSAFDPQLRADIRRALDQVKIIRKQRHPKRRRSRREVV